MSSEKAEKTEKDAELDNRVELVRSLCAEFQELNVKVGSLDPYSHAIVFRLGVGSMGSEEVAKYMASVAKSLDLKDLKKRGFFALLLPTRESETQISIVNLETMLRIQA